jgi:galactokinase
MDSRRIGAEGGATPSFVRPFLYALNRMQANEVLRPSQYMDRARSILMDRLGAGGGAPVTGFCRGAAGIIADQTHYFDGYALLLRLPQGVSVSARRNDSSHTRVVIEGVTEVLQFDAYASDIPGFGGLLAHLVQVQGGEQVQFDVSIVGGIPTGLGAAFHAAAACSFLMALDALHAEKDRPSSPAQHPADLRTDLRDMAIEALSRWYGHRFSPAFVIASLSMADDPFMLVDTSTMKYVPVPSDLAKRPGWAIVETSHDWKRPMAESQRRFDRAEAVTEALRTKGFAHIRSLRDVEHRELEQALSAVGRRHRATLRHLVSENRNVQKCVVAIRKADWQFLGALLMISQSSKTADWDTTGSLHEMVTDLAESASLDGIFGVVQSGEGGCMLVVGQPFSLPAFLDQVREKAASHTSEAIETFII